jgi:phosphoglycerate dehydrogenase-like enzyme
MSTDNRILIIHDGPHDYLDGLNTRFPDLPIEMISATESMEEALSRVEPTVAFAFRSGRFPGPTYKSVLNTPSLKWFQSGGVGIDHLPEWDPNKVTVTNAAGVAGKYMAETVTGAVLMLNFGFPEYIENQRNKIWAPKEWTSLDRKTALVIGLGGIGERVAERLQSFGMYVIGARNSDRPSFVVNEQINTTEILSVLPRADFVCVHVPNTPETLNLVDAPFLKAMKSKAYLINTARGAQVDDDALIAALNAGDIAGAYLDVFREEPLPENSPYWQVPNLVISPHVSDSVIGWEYNSAQFFADNIERYLKGEQLINICNPKMGY